MGDTGTRGRVCVAVWAEGPWYGPENTGQHNSGWLGWGWSCECPSMNWKHMCSDSVHGLSDIVILVDAQWLSVPYIALQLLSPRSHYRLRNINFWWPHVCVSVCVTHTPPWMEWLLSHVQLAHSEGLPCLPAACFLPGATVTMLSVWVGGGRGGRGDKTSYWPHISQLLTYF